MSVLVTGGTGTLGHHLLGLITHSRGEPTSFASLDPVHHRFHPHVRYVNGNLLNYQQIASLLQELRPAQIYHLASQSSVGLSQKEPLETLNTNILGTQNLLEAVRRTVPECRVLLLSSSDVYGPGEGLKATPFAPSPHMPLLRHVWRLLGCNTKGPLAFISPLFAHLTFQDHAILAVSFSPPLLSS